VSISGAPVAARKHASHSLVVRDLGLQDYSAVWQRMRTFTDARQDQTADELWVVQHPSVFTLGQAGKTEHILSSNGIPVVQSDRGGQVTYHGPGQLVVYTLLNLRRRKLGVRDLVILLERAVIGLLSDFGVSASGRRDAPGVYVGGCKIAALGLRVRRGCTYHGLALNVDVELSPFGWINPCGYPGLQVTSTAELGIEADCQALGLRLLQTLEQRLAAQLSDRVIE